MLPFTYRESFRTFRELSEIFSDDNNYSLSRELLVKVGQKFSLVLSLERFLRYLNVRKP